MFLLFKNFTSWLVSRTNIQFQSMFQEPFAAPYRLLLVLNYCRGYGGLSLSLSGGPVDPPIRVLTISCSHHLFTCFCRDFASHSTSCLNSRPRISPQHVTCQPCEKATRRSTYLKTGSPKHQETASSCYYCHGFLSQTHKSAQLSHQSCCGREGGQQSKSAAGACQHLPTSANICRCLWILWILWAANSSRCDLSQISLPGDEREEQLDANSSDDTLNILPAARAFSMDL